MRQDISLKLRLALNSVCAIGWPGTCGNFLPQLPKRQMLSQLDVCYFTLDQWCHFLNNIITTCISGIRMIQICDFFTLAILNVYKSLEKYETKEIWTWSCLCSLIWFHILTLEEHFSHDYLRVFLQFLYSSSICWSSEFLPKVQRQKYNDVLHYMKISRFQLDSWWNVSMPGRSLITSIFPLRKLPVNTNPCSMIA